MQKKIEIYTIHSQKGGVGKTSLALARAGWSALKKGKKTLVIDGDVTGTSLIDLFGRELKSSGFLNELLLADPRVFKQYRKHPEKVEAEFCVPVPDCGSINFIPSSPILDDIKIIVSLISQEDKLHFFENRIKDIIGIIVQNKFEVIIIDAPPGIYGISKAMLGMTFKETKEYTYNKQFIFLTSSDKVDYRALFPSLLKLCKEDEKYSFFNILFNKFSTIAPRTPAFKLTEIFKDLEMLLKERDGYTGIIAKADIIDAGPDGVMTLKRLVEKEFLKEVSSTHVQLNSSQIPTEAEVLEIAKDSFKSIWNILQPYDVVLKKIKDVAPFAGDFDMEKIISTIKKLSVPTVDRENCGPFEKWCLSIEDI